MRKFLFIILLFVYSLSTYSQTIVVKGEVINSETQQAVPYVNIGLKEKGIGTISNINGAYSLVLNQDFLPTEVISVSCVGFKTKEITLKDFKEISSITLIPSIISLEEIAIYSDNSKKNKTTYKPKKLGKAHKQLAMFHNFFHIYGEDEPNNLGREKGMILPINEDCLIQTLNFHISSNDYKWVKFRLHFYKIEKGKPTIILNQKDITFDVKDQYRGWYHLDLSPYHIQFTQEEQNIGVTLQWIDSEKANNDSRFFSISASPFASHRYHLSKDKMMGKWNTGKIKLNFFLEYDRLEG